MKENNQFFTDQNSTDFLKSFKQKGKLYEKTSWSINTEQRAIERTKNVCT